MQKEGDRSGGPEFIPIPQTPFLHSLLLMVMMVMVMVMVMVKVMI
jgi:hypothetical protein